MRNGKGQACDRPPAVLKGPFGFVETIIDRIDRQSLLYCTVVPTASYGRYPAPPSCEKRGRGREEDDDTVRVRIVQDSATPSEMRSLQGLMMPLRPRSLLASLLSPLLSLTLCSPHHRLSWSPLLRASAARLIPRASSCSTGLRRGGVRYRTATGAPGSKSRVRACCLVPQKYPDLQLDSHRHAHRSKGKKGGNESGPAARRLVRSTQRARMSWTGHTKPGAGPTSCLSSFCSLWSSLDPSGPPAGMRRRSRDMIRRPRAG